MVRFFFPLLLVSCSCSSTREATGRMGVVDWMLLLLLRMPVLLVHWCASWQWATEHRVGGRSAMQRRQAGAGVCARLSPLSPLTRHPTRTLDDGRAIDDEGRHKHCAAEPPEATDAIRARTDGRKRSGDHSAHHHACRHVPVAPRSSCTSFCPLGTVVCTRRAMMSSSSSATTNRPLHRNRWTATCCVDATPIDVRRIMRVAHSHPSLDCSR